MPSGSQFANNAATTIVNAITSSATSIQVAGGTTNLFPIAESGSLDSGMWFYATLFSSATVYEIVKVTYRQPNDPVWSIQRGREGTAAQSWLAGTALELRITAAGLKDYRENQPNIQHFTTVGSSTWVKPAGARMVFIQAWGAGGGGGSGRRRAIASQATAASGGAGGSGGGYREAWVIADALASTIGFSVPAGGLGGASQTADDANGNVGGIVSTSNDRVADVLTIPSVTSVTSNAPGGNTSATTSAPFPVSNVFSHSDLAYGTYNGRGGAGFSSGSTGPNPGAYGGGGGGGGGGYGANLTTGQSGSWGGPGALMSGSSVGGVTQQGTNGGPGDRTSVPSNLNTTTQLFGGGGGGGGSTTTFTSGQASPAGQNGGKGGWPGGGGGGGSASQGANSGAGGDGGDGYVRITTFF